MNNRLATPLNAESRLGVSFIVMRNHLGMDQCITLWPPMLVSSL